MKKELIAFLKKPIYTTYTNLSLQEKKSIFIKLLVLAITFSFGLGIVIGIFTTIFNIDVGKHGIDQLLEKYNVYTIFLLAVIGAPIIEELVFRGPLVFFKNSPYFNYIFYFSALLFGAVHISNFETFNEYLWLCPILVAPQIAAGFFLGFIRVKLNLGWSMLLHAGHNGILLSPLLLYKIIEQLS
ncbi:CPBP family intramembrane metalloprotease [Cellulophaga sp. HaHaR_3_176]|uniref:CPBP family intramembrane glutamic endopeptidase n=1 Tax=Cellulophaga sp. HaHaR_3_176 TaxID=1942464 RepID=UPI001C1F592B|nr:CPBP family intramembrane glutamic endopeptidase [Cellulophaga sp. HaHaR_3_176]QWX85387.1 CPBP family intramembrane metalloprotease [Cellulophaga sp. HaHaR_3_176]